MGRTEDFGDLGNTPRDLKADPQVIGPERKGTGDADKAAAAKASELDPQDGLTIEAAARHLGISEAEVWTRLRRGELIGRTEKGKLLIFAHPFTATAGEALDDSSENDESDKGSDGFGALPPLPGAPAVSGATKREPAVESLAGATTSQGWLTPQAGKDGAPQSTELALFIDYMSLAKEENQQLLRLTQDSIRKVSEMSDTIVQMKDAVIEAKDSTIVALKEQMAARDSEIRKLKQQMEDLEMLARTMATTAKE